MTTKTIAQLTGKTAVITDEIEVQATGGGASNKVTLDSIATAITATVDDVNAVAHILSAQMFR